MTERLSPEQPLPSDYSWPARRPPSPAVAAANAALEAQAHKTAAWLVTQHRDGIIPPAEKIVLDALRALQAIPAIDRMYADELMDIISRAYLGQAFTARDVGIRTRRRRLTALLRIGGEAA